MKMKFLQKITILMIHLKISIAEVGNWNFPRKWFILVWMRAQLKNQDSKFMQSVHA